jgi:glycosyltransferase involved in cell wall biosynthesis
VAPDSPKDFIDAVRDMVSSLQSARDMGQRGRQWVETHVSPAAVANSYLSLIDTM